jgi:hypothetical protein
MKQFQDDTTRFNTMPKKSTKNMIPEEGVVLIIIQAHPSSLVMIEFPSRHSNQQASAP